MTWEDFEFYLPAFGSIALAIVGAVVFFLASAMYRSWRKRNAKPTEPPKPGFTLLELLIAIGVLAIISTLALVAVRASLRKSRDAVRLSHMQTVVKALELYYQANKRYPDSDFSGYGTWETPGDGDFIAALSAGGFLAADVRDPKKNDTYGNYRYYRYAAGTYSCPTPKPYFVLGIVDLETVGTTHSDTGPSTDKHPDSPGWTCPGWNWQLYMDWVMGGYE